MTPLEVGLSIPFAVPHAASLPPASAAAAAPSSSGQSAAGAEQEAPVWLVGPVGALAALSEVGEGGPAESSVTVQSQGLDSVQQWIRAYSCRQKCCMLACINI